MRPIAKTHAACLPLRKTAVGAAAVHRPFPAWIDAEQGLAFSVLNTPGVTATPRVRAGLTLRAMLLPRGKHLRSSSDAPGVR